MKKFLVMTVIISVLISLFPAAGFAAGNGIERLYEEGMEYFEKEDYNSAIARFHVAGEARGYAPAQNMLGVCYRDGLGTEQDKTKAEEYFEKAAAQGDSAATANLAAIREEKGHQKTVPGPATITVSLDDQDHPVISWEAVPNAKNYKVVSSEDNVTFGSPIYSDSVEITRYNKYEEGKTYYFKVCAVFPDGTESEYSGSGSVRISRTLDAPKIISIELDSDAHPVLKWTKVGGASAYEVYVSPNGSSYSRLAYAIKATEYTVKSSKTGITYYYKVRAVAADKTEGKFSSPKKFKIPLSKAISSPTPSMGTESSQNLETDLDFVIWKDGKGVIETVQADKMYVSSLKTNQVFAPRLRVNNRSNTTLSPSVSAKIVGDAYTWTVDWVANPIEPYSWREVVAGSCYDGPGRYQYTFYINNVEVVSGEYTVRDEYGVNSSLSSAISNYYTVGTESTFESLYKKMCINLDIKTYPIPTEGSKKTETYGTGDYEQTIIVKDDNKSYENVGYIYAKDGKNPKYIVRNWVGYHEQGEKIQMKVFYTTDGKYIGNIRMDLTNNRSNSSSHSPYFIGSEGTHSLK